jgi:sugar phosphate isomerase/epimerase
VSSASIDLPVERGYSAVAGQQTLSAADRLREHSDRAMEDCVNLSRVGMNTVTLAGDLEAKLHAISNAGFQAIELWAKDLTADAGGVAAASRAVSSSGLRISSFQLLRDFEGPPDAMLRYELDTVKPIMELMHAVGCDPAPVVMEGARKSVEWLGARTSLAAPGANRLSEPAR